MVDYPGELCYTGNCLDVRNTGRFAFSSAVDQHNIHCGQSAPYQVDSRPAVRLGNDGKLGKGRFAMTTKIPIQYASMDEWLSAWYLRHTDVDHGGSRETCEHCQAMIQIYGEMPPRKALAQYRPPSQPTYTKRPIPKQIRAAILKRDNYTCLECGSRDDLTIDHIIPESRGGTMDANNLKTLCRRCNSRKGTK